MLATEKTEKSRAAAIIGIITTVLAFVAAASTLAIPSISSWVLSLKNVRLSSGLASPWVGVRNYQFLFSAPGFQQSMLASFRFALLSGLFAFLFSAVIGTIVRALANIRWLMHAITTLLLIPLILPGEVWASWYLKIFTLNTQVAIFAVPAWCAIKYTGIAALLVSAAVRKEKLRFSAPLIASGILSISLLALLGRFDFTFLRQMPASLSSVWGLDVYSFRVTFELMELGVGAAIGVVQGVLRFILLSAIAWPVSLLVRRLFPAQESQDASSHKDRLISLAVTGAVIIVAAIALAISSAPGAGNNPPLTTLPMYLGIAILSALLNTILCFLVAQPVACAGKAGRITSAAALLLLTVIGSAAAQIGEFFLFSSARVMNTVIPVVLSGSGAVWGAWALALAAKSMGVRTYTDWYRRMWKPGLALFAVQAALLFNNTTPSLLYMNKASYMHPLLLLFGKSSVGTMGGAWLAVIVAPVAFLLIARTVLDDKESLGLVLPGR